MILTNLDHVKGRDVLESLGLAVGYAAVATSKKGGKAVLTGGEARPWADAPEDFEALFRQAEKRLIASALEMGADAVIKIEAKLSRDVGGNPEMLLVGTAVKLLGVDGAEAALLGTKESQTEENKDSVHITIEGTSAEWAMDQTTARKDILRLMRERGKGSDVASEAENDTKDDRKMLHTLAETMGISFERAQQLSDAGLSDPRSIAEADLKVLLELPNINPTQARIIKGKARELTSGK